MKKETEKTLKDWEKVTGEMADRLGQMLRELPSDMGSYDIGVIYARFDTAKLALMALTVSLQLARELPKHFVKDGEMYFVADSEVKTK